MDPIEKEMPKIIVDLVKQGAKVKHTDDENRTALHLAVMGNRLPLVEYLLQKGANIYVRLKSILRKMSDH